MIAAKLETFESIMPAKLRARYEKYYGMFADWCKQHGVLIEKCGVGDFLAWVEMMGRYYKQTSIWAMMTGVKVMLLYYHNINSDGWKGYIAKYMREKKKKKKEEIKKAPVFDGKQMERIWRLNEEKYLLHLFAFGVGLFGGLRRQDYADLRHEDIKIKKGVCFL